MDDQKETKTSIDKDVYTKEKLYNDMMEMIKNESLGSSNSKK